MSHLTRLAAQLGYAVHNGIAYGRTSGIYFNVKYTSDGPGSMICAYIRPLESLTFRDTGRGGGIDLIRIREYLKVRRREFPNNGMQADERSVWFTLNGEAGLKPGQIARFVYEFSRFLSEQGYVSSCAACPETRHLIHASLDSQVLEVCGGCLNRLGAQAIMEHDGTGSLWRGAAGAALGGLIGVIPWVLLSFTWLIASVCGIFMAYLADKGYRLANGRHGRIHFVCITAMLIVLTYIAITTGYALDEYRGLLHQGTDMGLLQLTGQKLTALFRSDSSDATALWIRLGVGWLFSGIGGFTLILRQRHVSAADKTVRPEPKCRI